MVAFLAFTTCVWAQPGQIDQSFTTFANDRVLAMAAQTDGRIVLAGDFTAIAGVGHLRIARLNADGTLDTTFNALADGEVSAVAIQGDGKILVGGSFGNINGVQRNRIARLTPTGALDPTFDCGVGPNSQVLTLACQPDGRILFGGSFTTFVGLSRNYIGRMNSGGGLDTGFGNGAGPSGAVSSLVIQTNGDILIGGSFTNVNGIGMRYIARLNPDGSLDSGFNPGTGPNNPVNCIALQPDQRILIGGSFSNVGGTNRQSVARLMSDGSLDPTFVPTNTPTAGVVNALVLQSDGKMLIGGSFASGIAMVLRLGGNGVKDATFLNFFGSVGFSGATWSLVLETDGKLLVGAAPTPYFSIRLRGDAPFVDTQPTNQTVLSGGVASLSAAGSGAAPYFYQWYQDGSPLAGASGSSLTLTNVQAAQSGNYFVVISNYAGIVTSQVASVTLYGAPVTYADAQVVAGTAVRNFSSTMTLQTAFPDGYIFYTLDGSTPTFSSPLYTAAFALTNSATVRAIALSQDFSQMVSGPQGRIVIRKRALSLSGGAGYITAAPNQALFEDGAAVILTAVADSSWSFEQWQGGATGSNSPVSIVMDSDKTVQSVFTTTLVTNVSGSGHIEVSPSGNLAYGTAVQLRAVPDTGNVFVVWGNAVSGTTNPMQFAVNFGAPVVSALFSASPSGTPVITLQPTGQVAKAGAQVTLSVGACCGTFSYQWRLNGVPIPGATGSSFALASLDASSVGDYDVLITGGGASVVSSTAKILMMDFGVRPVVSVFGRPGTAFSIQYSDNLGADPWHVLTNDVLVSQRDDVIDFSNTNTQKRFYRVGVPP